MAEPVWEQPGYVGFFGDAYVASTELEGGHIAHALQFASQLLSRLVQRGSLDQAEVASRLGRVAKSAAEAATRVLQAQKAEDLLSLLSQFTSGLKDIPFGEAIIVPGGWRGTTNGWIAYIVERSADGSFSLCVSNRGPGGLQYHPTKLVPVGKRQKLKSLATLRVEGVPPDRIADAGFWALAFAQWASSPSEQHRPEVLYDVLLPWVAGVAGAERLTSRLCGADSAASWRTPCRSNTSFMKSVLEAFRYLGHRWGLDDADCKRLSVLLRAEALMVAAEELAPRAHVASSPAEEAVAVLRAAGATLPELLSWERLQPAERSPQCKVVALFFSRPGRLTEAVSSRLSELTTLIWERHGAGSFKVVECPLAPRSTSREWPECQDAVALARDFGVELDREGERSAALLLFQSDGRLITKEGVQVVGKDPHGDGFPWLPPGLADKDQRLLRWGCGGVARAAMKQGMQAHYGKLALAVEALVKVSPKAGIASWVPPDCQLPSSVEPKATVFPRGEMFRRQLVDELAGSAEEPRKVEPVDFCTLPESVATAAEAAKALAVALTLAKANVRRSREANITQRLALEYETIALVSSVFLDLLPVPEAAEGRGIWAEALPVGDASLAEIQKQTLKAIVQLASLYAHCWQSVEHPTRAFDSERCLASACMMCHFDAVARMQLLDAGGVSQASILLPGLLREDGGYSVGLGVCADQRPLRDVFGRLELVESHWMLVQSRALTYLLARERQSRHRIFEYRMPDGFEIRKYSATMLLLRKVLERKGLEVVPRDGPPMSEMEALSEWLFGRFGQLTSSCPEMCWLRDMALLFKFLCTMETRSAELLRKRKDVNEFQFWRLTFDADAAMRPAGLGWQDDAPTIFWEVAGVRGQEQDIADVTARAFGRSLTLGDGPVVQSPADLARLVERPGPTEDDILHMRQLPSFEDTLSQEESEALLSFLTVPYLQVPLILDFFAMADRATYLFSPRLQKLLRAVLFEPRTCREPRAGVHTHVPARGSGCGGLEADDSESEAEALFGSCCGLLLSELVHCPNAVLEPLQVILQSTAEVARGEVYSSEAPFLLYMLELAVDMLAFVEYAAAELTGPERPEWLRNAPPGAAEALACGQGFLRQFVGQFRETLSEWTRQAGSRSDTPTCCVAHGYLTLEGLPTASFSEAMASWSFVRTWHTFGSCVDDSDGELTPNERLRRFLQAQGIDTKKTDDQVLGQFTCEEGRYRPVFLHVGNQTIRVPSFRKKARDGQASRAPGSVPEARLFRALQKHRAGLVRRFGDSPSEALSRVACVALRSELGALSWIPKGLGVFTAEDLQFNVQTGELLWREDGLRPLPDSMTRFEDFETIFGDSSLQCGMVSRAKHRLWVHVVGREFDLVEWSPSAQAAFKQGLGPASQPDGSGPNAARFCGMCGLVGKCWQCASCTMINCNAAAATECSVCGTRRMKDDSEDEAPGLQQAFSMLGGRRRGRAKVKPVTACAFGGQRYGREYDVYADPPAPVPDTEQWAMDILRPIVETLFPPDPPGGKLRYKLLLPDSPLESHAHEFRLLGFDPGAEPNEATGDAAAVAQAKEEENKAATWKEILVSKTHKSVMVFNWIPHGRRLYRSLTFCSRQSVALHNLALDTPDAQKLRGAGGSWSTMRPMEGSLCIIRKNQELGVCEQYVCPRLLRGVVPSALLEAYSFWEGEDSIIRGVPNDDQSSYFSKNLEIVLEDPPSSGFWVRRLPGKFPRPRGEFAGLARPAAATPERDVKFAEADVLQLAELGFAPAACRLALQKCRGDSAAAAEWLFDDGNAAQVLAADLPSSAPMVVDEDDELQTALRLSMGEAAITALAATPSAELPPEDRPEDMELETAGPAWTLVDLLSACEGTALASLAKLLVRVEDLSHVLVWANSAGDSLVADQIALVELPRLKLSLLPEKGILTLVDSGGSWVVKTGLIDGSAEKAVLDSLLHGLEQALVLESGSRELRVLLPNHDVSRPSAKGDPFTTTLVFNRSSFGWKEVMDSPYYMYAVHTTQSFLQSTRLAAELYLVLLRLMSRNYLAAAAGLEACWTDTPLLPEEQWVFNQFAGTLEDGHPDAHAVRCKLALSAAFVEDLTLPFELHLEVDKYLAKRAHVSRGLRLSEDEELQLLRLCKASTPRVKARIEYLGARARGQATATLRAAPARHGGEPWSKISSQSLQALARASRVTRLQFRHPGLGEGQQDGDWPDKFGEAGLMKLLWTDELLQDDESGINRQLGFIFCYMVLTGQLSLALSGADVSSSLGALLTRVFQLKCARWGREVVEEGESEPQPSWQMATLALVSRGVASFAGWPAVPSGAASRRSLSAGQNLYDAQGRESAMKRWLDGVDQIFAQTLVAVGVPEPPCAVELDDWAPPLSVQVAQEADGAGDERWRPLDSRCARRDVAANFAPKKQGADMLAELGVSRFLAQEQKHVTLSPTLPFDLSRHAATRTVVAQDLLGRLAQDCQRYAAMKGQHQDIIVCGLTPHAVFAIARGQQLELSESIGAQLLEVKQLLQRQSAEDLAKIHALMAAITERANTLEGQEEPVFLHRLRRDLCGQEALTGFHDVVCCALSTGGQEDLCALNPFMPPSAEVLDSAVGVSLLVGRLNLANRASFQCQELIDSLHDAATGSPAREEAEAQATAVTICQLADRLGESLTTRRCYLHSSERPSWLDPRYLVFEYLQKIVLRPRQVEMVDWFMKSRSEGQSRVQQMIMGAGKTTVVGPLLSMMLADEGTLVTQVMPAPLLDQTRQILRACFSTLVPKRIVTFQFDRQVEDCPETVMKIYAKLQACRATCGVVCSSPEAIKSMLLKFIEQLNTLAAFDFDSLAPGASMRANRDLARARDTLGRRSEMGDAIVRVMQLWQAGVVIMDEVDVLLHPLKSELNFPIGFRDPIDLSGHRWDLPIHIIDGAFCASGGHSLSDSNIQGTVSSEMESDMDHSGHLILRDLRACTKQGCAEHALQRTPHVVLLDAGFYHRSMKRHYAAWALVWLKKHFVGACGVEDSILLDFMTADLDAAIGYKDTLERGLAPFSLKLLNLAGTWIRAILPHVLSKVERVGYGLLDDKQLKSADDKTPFSRKVMAVPFVGKDVPSRSSEFAHPDVAIGLTILAYRYEGLRQADVWSIVSQLKQDCTRQLGPRDTRPAHVLFESWVRHEPPASPAHKMRRMNSGQDQLAQNILPLALFQPLDSRQMARLYKQLHFLPAVTHFWLRQHVFPATMNFHCLKISASGHEIGSSMLFGHRVGFSGTPSNLLPQDLGECFYEPGSDGQVIHVLTDPPVATAEVTSVDWSPAKLLQQVAEGGAYHALIDTGALITNMDNERVARELLANLPPDHFDGVVFLDQSDRKMILVKSSSGRLRAVALAASGVPPERRFTFFDQVHTTGMDILMAPCAKAAVTIGKDMTFRDYAQGAFRMRKVGQGQTIHVLVIPEVKTRIAADLGAACSGRLLLDVPAWLLVNSCRSESVQSLKLLSQELTNGWRKRALETLTAEVVANSFASKQPTAERMRRFEPGPEAPARRAALQPFQDRIGFVVDDKVRPGKSHMEALRLQCQEHAAFCTSEQDRQRQESVLAQAAREVEAADEEEMRYGFTAEVVHEQEQEQQQEQEEEQEEEQENAFARDDEQANPWAVTALSEGLSTATEQELADRPFYRLSCFRSRPEQPLLPVDARLWLTDNFFRTRWVGCGERKLKSAFIVLEWHPELSKERHKRGLQARMKRYFAEAMTAAQGNATLAAMECLNRARESVKTEPFSDEELAGWNAEGFGRDIVVLTLAEAETLRWIVRGCLHPVVREVGIAFRTISGRLLDRSPAFVHALPSEGPAADALLCLLRLFNSDMFFRDDQLSSLEGLLNAVPLQVRQSWFEENLRLRRRSGRHVWLDTPVARLFTPQEEWSALRSQALLKALCQALRERGRPEDAGELIEASCWSHDALRSRLLRMRLGFSAGDLGEAVRAFSVDERGFIPGEAVCKGLRAEEALRALQDVAGQRAARLAQEEAERQEKASRVWQCQNCTFFNSALSSTCAVCDFGWTGQRECPPDKWCCMASQGGCTFFNSQSLYYCDVCGRARPDLASLTF